jgi:hypothetical protein
MLFLQYRFTTDPLGRLAPSMLVPWCLRLSALNRYAYTNKSREATTSATLATSSGVMVNTGEN